jgi:aldehyde dehydrogenase (NAD+)/aldehyde dehydrogenase (NAD(P)+)
MANGTATTTKWWGKYFFLALALAIAGGLTKPVKIFGSKIVPRILGQRGP